MIPIETDPFKFRLCYVDSRDNFAWFTSIPLEHQWGDDWNDAPYEHNAGEPYFHHWIEGETRQRVEHPLVQVAWKSVHVTPCHNYLNSSWSVQSINNGNIAWLLVEKYDMDTGAKPIPSGTTLLDFISSIHACQGEVYLPTGLAHQYSETINNKEK